MGIAETEAFFEIALDIVSVTGATGCSDGTVEGKVAAGKELEVKLVVVGIKEEGYSGKFGACRLDPPVGKDELKPENCICGMEGGMEGGMASPGGGRSKDCCCICGSTLDAIRTLSIHCHSKSIITDILEEEEIDPKISY